MYVKILYNKEAEKGLIGDWGFSCLVGDETLFDTGSDHSILKHNIRQLGVDLGKIKRVVLSHQHYDHVGGIGILQDLGNVEVFITSDLPSDLMAKLTTLDNVKLRTVSGKEKITDGLWTTGEIKGKVMEQALVVETDKGITIISGCLHEGVKEALEVAYTIGDAYGIVGGQHNLEEQDVECMTIIVPCHCTKGKSVIKEAYPTQVIDCKVGLVIEI